MSLNRLVIGEPQRNILFEKRLKDIKEKHSVRKQKYRKNDQDLAKMSFMK